MFYHFLNFSYDLDSKNNQAAGNNKQNGSSKLLLFDNCAENYTERWVSSTASIPPDMKIVPEQDHHSYPSEYSQNLHVNQVVTNGWISDDKVIFFNLKF